MSRHGRNCGERLQPLPLPHHGNRIQHPAHCCTSSAADSRWGAVRLPMTLVATMLVVAEVLEIETQLLHKQVRVEYV